MPDLKGKFDFFYFDFPMTYAFFFSEWIDSFLVICCRSNCLLKLIFQLQLFFRGIGKRIIQYMFGIS